MKLRLNLAQGCGDTWSTRYDSPCVLTMKPLKHLTPMFLRLSICNWLTLEARSLLTELVISGSRRLKIFQKYSYYPKRVIAKFIEGKLCFQLVAHFIDHVERKVQGVIFSFPFRVIG